MKRQKKRKSKLRKNVSQNGAMYECQENEKVAEVVENRGAKTFMIETSTGEKYLATLKGTVAKKDIINVQDKVVVQIESILPTGCVIVHKYNQSEKNVLKKMDKSKVEKGDDDPFEIEDANDDVGIVGSDDDIDPDDI